MKLHMIMVIAAFVIFAGIGLWSLSSDTNQDTGMSPDMSACTLEALMCPDGSSVGRSGEQCTFSACPQVPYLIGELEQIGGDFQLIVETEMGERGSVVPLQVQISNALGTLVGKRVQAFGRFEVGNTFIVETLQEPVQTDESVLQGSGEGEAATAQLRYQEQVTVDGITVTFAAVEEDSRCPSDVTCITAGTFTASLEFREGEGKEVVQLSTGESIIFGTRTVSIESVLPVPDSRVQIEPSNYVLTLRIE